MTAAADSLDGAIPHSVSPHPVTGVNNGKLAIWMFLASEVMLFGALFSSYVLIRVGSPSWPHGRDIGLNVPMAFTNTLVLIASSVTVVMAWAQLKLKNFTLARVFLGFTILGAMTFLVIKYFEYREHILAGDLPSKNDFFALYFTLTGLHGLHVIGGIVVMLYLIGPGAYLWQVNPEKYTNRFECTGLYWHFVDLIWIFLFPILYLL